MTLSGLPSARMPTPWFAPTKTTSKLRSASIPGSSGPKVVPFRLWQVSAPGIRARFSDGIHEEGWAEHELVSDCRGARIGAEIHHQSAHGRVALACGHPRQGIDVRQQPVAKRVIA